MRARSLSTIAGGLLTLATWQAAAQSDAPLSANPIEHPNPELAPPAMETKPQVSNKIRPTPPSRLAPALPQLQALDIPRPSPSLYPEGTFLVGRLGVLHLIETGDLVFAPAIEPGARGEPVLVLISSTASERLRGMIEPGQFTWEGRLSGEVFLYRGRNMLLVSAFAPVAVDRSGSMASAPQNSQETDDTTDPAATPSGDAADTPTDPTPPVEMPIDPANDPADQTPGALDPRVSALAEELLAERTIPRAIDPTMDRPLARGQEGPAEVVPNDGSLIVRRRARMVRDGSGRWQIRFDQDGQTREAALTVVPCQLLELMERQTEREGYSWTFHISGRVVASPGGASIIPTLFLSERPTDVNPLQ